MFNAIGINVYGGGFTLGVQKNFKVLGQWEEVDLGYKTWELNFDKTKIDHPKSIDEWPIEKFVGVPFVYANPPCAPWSSANMRKGYTKERRFSDVRLHLTDHTMAAALKLQPIIFISESVENAYNIGFSFYRKFIDQWLAANYAVTIFLTDAVIHGLPSIRRRFHFIAHRYALNLTPPNLDNFKATTVRQAFYGLPEGGDVAIQHDVTAGLISAKKASRLFIVANGGENMHSAYNRVFKNEPNYNGPRGSFLKHKLMWDSPSNTCVGLQSQVHPEQPRFTTFREGMRLLSMPDTYKTLSSIDASDNVTPLIGEYLSKIVFNSLKTKIMAPIIESLIDWRPLGKKYGISAHKKLLKEDSHEKAN
jgi:site-specific DNA-cytosine methylase